MTSHRTRHLFLYLTVLITGAVVLVIEILGTRILAPFFGSTIFVWSALISVALGFLSLGYLLGGWLADKNPDFKNLYGIIFFAGITCSLIIKLDQPVLVFADNFGFRFGPLISSIILFAPTLFLLGAVTPFTIRLRTHFLDNLGSNSGSIFAISTIGSLAGAILSGFFLIPYFSLTSIFIVTSTILIILAAIGYSFFLISKA